MDSRETIRLRGKPPQTGPVTGRERQDETIGHAVTCAPTEGPFAPHTWKGPFTFVWVSGGLVGSRSKGRVDQGRRVP